MFLFYKQQESSDCGPACIRMVVKHYKKNITMQTLRDLCHIDREGVSIEAIKNACEKIGLKAVPVKTTLDGQKHEHALLLQDLPFPLISFWDNNHFVVIYKIKKDKIYIADPAMGLLIMSVKEAEKHLFSNENPGKAVLLEPERFFYDKVNPYFENQLMKTQLRFITKHLLSTRKQFTWLLLAILIKLLFQVVSPYLTQQTFDKGILAKDLNILGLIFLIQIIVFAAGSLITYFENLISNKISYRINLSLTEEFIGKIFKIPLSYFQKRKTSDFIYRIYDLNKIESFLTYNFSSILFSFLGVLILSAMVIFYNAKIFLIFILYSLVYALWTKFTLQRKRELNSEKFDIQVSAHKYLTEIVEGIHEIKLNNSESKKMEVLLSNQKKYFLNDLKNMQVSQFLSIGGGLINNIFIGLINFYAAYLAITNVLTIGEMAAIQLLVLQLNSQALNIYTSASLMLEVKFSLERILEIHSLKNESFGSEPIHNPKSIEFKNVQFAYTEMSTPVIKKVSFSIECKKTTAIVGTSGSGKTTLMRLALGMLIPTEGRILVDGKMLQEHDLSSWTRRCGVVMQDGYIFNDTIINNITESGREVIIENYIKALKQASLYDFVMSLPITHQTIIGRGGLSLSSGQSQRILIARMIYKNPDFIFMDEATNSLDAETEKHINQELESLFSNKTRLVIAHRLNTVKYADKIIVLKNGVIAEEGTHFELIEQKGFYYELVKEQLQLS